MVYSKFILLLCLLYSKILSSDSSNETNEKYNLQQYNDSTFIVKTSNTKRETNQDRYLKEWAFSPSTVNAILRNNTISNHSSSPRKREARIEYDSSRYKRKLEDNYYTVRNETMGKPFNVSDILKNFRQANSFSEHDVKISVLSELLNETAKVHKEREEITLKPMPFLTTSNKSTEHPRAELDVSSAKKTTLYIEEIESKLGRTDITKTQTSERFPDFNETYPEKSFDYVSETNTTLPTTYNDSDIHTSSGKITNTSRFKSTDGFTSLSVDSSNNRDTTYISRAITTEKEYYNYNTTLTISRGHSSLKLNVEETNYSSTGTPTEVFPPSLFRKDDENEITTKGPSTSYIHMPDVTVYNYPDFNKSIKIEPTSTNASTFTTYNSLESQSYTDDKGFYYKSNESSSSNIPVTLKTKGSTSSFSSPETKSSTSSSSSPETKSSTSSSSFPDLSLAAVKILPVDQTVLLTGIILISLTCLILSALIIVCYCQRKKKSTSHQIEMKSLRFDVA